MHVNVITLTGNKYDIEIPERSTVHDIKLNINENHNFPIASQKLIYVGKELQNAATLAECGIEQETSLHLVIVHQLGTTPEQKYGKLYVDIEAYIAGRKNQQVEDVRNELATVDTLIEQYEDTTASKVLLAEAETMLQEVAALRKKYLTLSKEGKKTEANEFKCAYRKKEEEADDLQTRGLDLIAAAKNKIEAAKALRSDVERVFVLDEHREKEIKKLNEPAKLDDAENAVVTAEAYALGPKLKKLAVWRFREAEKLLVQQEQRNEETHTFISNILTKVTKLEQSIIHQEQLLKQQSGKLNKQEQMLQQQSAKVDTRMTKQEKMLQHQSDKLNKQEQNYLW